MKELSQEQIQEYIQRREKFLALRGGYRAEITAHLAQAKTHQTKAKRLERVLASHRPKLPGCDAHTLCTRCDIYSVQYRGVTPVQGGGIHHYQCVLCHRKVEVDNS